jgi:hypothetical protein
MVVYLLPLVGLRRRGREEGGEGRETKKGREGGRKEVGRGGDTGGVAKKDREQERGKRKRVFACGFASLRLEGW